MLGFSSEGAVFFLLFLLLPLGFWVECAKFTSVVGRVLEITVEIINNLLREINIKGQQQIININTNVYPGKPQIQGKTQLMKFHQALAKTLANLAK